MSDYLRKIHQLQKKANYRNSILKIEIDLILDESNPKYHWNRDDWREYIQYQKQKGNKVIYLCGEMEQAQKEELEELELIEQELEELEQFEQMEFTFDFYDDVGAEQEPY